MTKILLQIATAMTYPQKRVKRMMMNDLQKLLRGKPSQDNEATVEIQNVVHGAVKQVLYISEEEMGYG